VVEMNTGQMIEDVRLTFDGRVPVSFFGRCGGVVPVPEEVLEAVHTMVETSKEVVC
jgi:2-oxoglutarate ferredoxin oxidoreductase subunit alpha